MHPGMIIKKTHTTPKQFQFPTCLIKCIFDEDTVFYEILHSVFSHLLMVTLH